MIQGGDPLGNGTGGPGYSVDREAAGESQIHQGRRRDGEGGTEPPGTSGSQFFVVTGAEAGLPPEYALVGNVSKGMDVVEQIGEPGNPKEEPNRRS